MIVIVDYEVGNVGSILNMCKRVEIPAALSRDPSVIAKAQKLILPGVGAFDAGMERLVHHNLIEVLRRRVLDERAPLLGICLGMQLLGSGSEEGARPGLGLLPARCVRFAEDRAKDIKVPHMGWNVVTPTRPHALFKSEDPELRFYFVHSYHVVPDDPSHALATTNYGGEFTSAIGNDNVLGVQFHPEKSHRFGMRLMANFAAM